MILLIKFKFENKNLVLLYSDNSYIILKHKIKENITFNKLLKIIEAIDRLNENKQRTAVTMRSNS